MALIHVPYHLDEHLPDLGIPVPDGVAIDEVTVALPPGEVWPRLVRLYDGVAEAVAAQARSGSTATVLSGDCTVSAGVAAGLQRAGVDPSVVWFDAHGDVHTLATSESGYLGGMALRFLLGHHSEALAEPLGLRPLPEERAVLVDARDLDPAEVDFLAASALRRLGIADLSAADLPDGPLLVNLDMDTLDSALLPGLRYPAAGGPDADALLRAVQTVAATGRVAAVNLACTWNPGGDPEGRRGHLVSAVLAAVDG
ncbi:arginase family protein [Glycomyces sp. TRM65418]|uniref:arginase family protein n=1 Tax=Glycomyces sp. TRM65418 TaxID=2867006 RepID=UPI001CE4F62D|nr:arginase family protein [Glycomyces sp. TRM65418]MCC3764652.1 arginase family protein [Glycomyces sp. TRM65418]QZD54314.1 arginase family protein [Glycomyces sp. TRM65418]